MSARRAGRSRASLSVRYLVVVLISQVVFGSVLALAIGLSAVRTATEERARALRSVSAAIAASLMPVIADQDPVRVDNQLASITGLESEDAGIVCVRLVDASGKVIAESEPECTCDLVPAPAGWLSRFTQPAVVEQPIEVDSMRVGTVSVQFEPPGLNAALLRPLWSTSGVVLLVVAVTGSWTLWYLSRNLVEPIEEIQTAAESIAAGRRDVRLDASRGDELGRLAHALDEMTEELDRQERALRGSYRSLEIAYEEQALMREQVQAAAQAKSDFVAIASHELRSPLAVIRLYAEMLREGDFGELPKDLSGAVDSIVSASARLATIVTALMDVALLERGVMPLEYSDVRVDEIAREAVRDAARLGAERGVAVRTAGRLARVRLRGDRVRLRQVLDNLLSNAIKYSTGPATVEVTVTRAGEDVLIAVRDEGRGIPPDRADALFEPFIRLDTKDNAETSGIGLGLPISASIARAHGGDIAVAANDRGAGSVFTLRLPIAGADRKDEARPGDMPAA